MPFRSQMQRRFMYAEHPEIARKWDNEFPKQGPLPVRAGGVKPVQVQSPWSEMMRRGQGTRNK